MRTCALAAGLLLTGPTASVRADPEPEPTSAPQPAPTDANGATAPADDSAAGLQRHDLRHLRLRELRASEFADRPPALRRTARHTRRLEITGHSLTALTLTANLLAIGLIMRSACPPDEECPDDSDGILAGVAVAGASPGLFVGMSLQLVGARRRRDLAARAEVEAARHTRRGARWTRRADWIPLEFDVGPSVGPVGLRRVDDADRYLRAPGVVPTIRVGSVVARRGVLSGVVYALPGRNEVERDADGTRSTHRSVFGILIRGGYELRAGPVRLRPSAELGYHHGHRQTWRGCCPRYDRTESELRAVVIGPAVDVLLPLSHRTFASIDARLPIHLRTGGSFRTESGRAVDVGGALTLGLGLRMR